MFTQFYFLFLDPHLDYYLLSPNFGCFFPWTNSRLLPSFNFRFFSPWINSRLLYLLTYFWIAFFLHQLWITIFLDPFMYYCFLDQPNLHYSLGCSSTFVYFNWSNPPCICIPNAFGYSIKFWCLTKTKDMHRITRREKVKQKESKVERKGDRK